MRPLPAVVAALGVLAASSCGHPNQWADRMDTLKATVADTIDAGPVQLRCNPVECSCPPFEMLFRDRWVRVRILESSDPENPLDAMERTCGEDAGKPAQPARTVRASLERGKPLFCANGTPYFEVAVRPGAD